MKKMLMALLLCAALLPLCAGACAAEDTPAPIEPAEAFAGGSGTAEDPFQIATAQQLALLAKVTHQEYEWNQWDEKELYLEGCYVLTADIALNDTSNFANWESEPPAYVWDPIGAASKDREKTYLRFSGVFDGQGHTISGLYSLSARLHEKEQIAGGLFGEAFQAEIRNVNLTDSMLIAADKESAGLLVGSGSGSVMENCHVSGRLIVNNVAASGGVAKAVEEVIHRVKPDKEVKTVYAEGLRECRQMLRIARAGKYDGYLLEGMACPGGCIAGPGTVQPPEKSKRVLEQYKAAAPKANPLDSDYMSDIHLLHEDSEEWDRVSHH